MMHIFLEPRCIEIAPVSQEVVKRDWAADEISTALEMAIYRYIGAYSISTSSRVQHSTERLGVIESLSDGIESYSLTWWERLIVLRP